MTQVFIKCNVVIAVVAPWKWISPQMQTPGWGWIEIRQVSENGDIDNMFAICGKNCIGSKKKRESRYPGYWQLGMQQMHWCFTVLFLHVAVCCTCAIFPWGHIFKSLHYIRVSVCVTVLSLLMQNTRRLSVLWVDIDSKLPSRKNLPIFSAYSGHVTTCMLTVRIGICMFLSRLFSKWSSHTGWLWLLWWGKV